MLLERAYSYCTQCYMPLPLRSGPGRPRKYCSTRCRRAHERGVRREREAHRVTPMRPCTCNRDYLTVPLEEDGWCVGCHH